LLPEPEDMLRKQRPVYSEKRLRSIMCRLHTSAGCTQA
jgi:hypothetical protein